MHLRKDNKKEKDDLKDKLKYADKVYTQVAEVMSKYQMVLCDTYETLYSKAANEVRTASEDQLALIEECRQKCFSIDKKLHQHEINLCRLE